MRQYNALPFRPSLSGYGLKSRIATTSALIALMGTLSHATLPLEAWAEKPWERPNNAQEETIPPVATLSYSQGILTLESGAFIVPPRWETWDSQADNHPTRMVVMDFSNLSLGTLANVKEALEAQAVTLRQTQPDLVRVLCVKRDDATLRLIVELRVDDKPMASPAVLYSEHRHVRVVFVEPSQELAFQDKETEILPSQEMPVETVATVPQLPERIDVDLSSGQLTLLEEPPQFAAPLTLSMAPSQETKLPVETAPAPKTVTPLKTPAASNNQNAAQVKTVYETRLKALEATLATTRKTLQAKESSLALLNQQQAQLKQTLKIKQTDADTQRQHVTQLKLQLANAQKKPIVKAAVCQPQSVKPADSTTPAASTAMFLELQRVMKERESIALELKQSKADLEKTQQDAKQTIEALQAKLEEQNTASPLLNDPNRSEKYLQSLQSHAMDVPLTQIQPKPTAQLATEVTPVIGPVLSDKPQASPQSEKTEARAAIVEFQAQPQPAATLAKTTEPALEPMLEFTDSKPLSAIKPSTAEPVVMMSIGPSNTTETEKALLPKLASTMHFTDEGLTQEQQHALETEIKQYPDHWSAYLTLAAHYRRKGDLLSAQNTLKNLLLLDPQNISALLQLTDVYLDGGHLDEAQRTVQVLQSQAGDRLEWADDLQRVQSRLLKVEPQTPRAFVP